MSNEQTAPATKGVTVKLLATVDLGPEIEVSDQGELTSGKNRQISSIPPSKYFDQLLN